MSHDKIASPLWLVTQSIHDPSFLHFENQTIQRNYKEGSDNRISVRIAKFMYFERSDFNKKKIMENLECVKFIRKFLLF